MIPKTHHSQASNTLTRASLAGARQCRTLLCWAGMTACGTGVAQPAETAPAAAQAQPQTALSQIGNLYVREYRVKGNHILKPIE